MRRGLPISWAYVEGPNRVGTTYRPGRPVFNFKRLGALKPYLNLTAQKNMSPVQRPAIICALCPQ